MSARTDTDRHTSPDRHCSSDECEATIRDHAWGHITSDWFIQRNGDAWCPKHTPAWVPEWRARKASKLAGKSEEQTENQSQG